MNDITNIEGRVYVTKSGTDQVVSEYNARDKFSSEQLCALANKVANAPQGHDTLGPTGLVVHLTPAEQDAIVVALIQRALSQ